MALLVTGNKRAPLRERADDLYETPPCAVHALMRFERSPQPAGKLFRIWEPAAGRGAIVDVLRTAGHYVLASDLIEYGIPDQLVGVDFLLERERPPDIDLILTNPPYKLAAAFVEHALALCPRVIMLMRLAFLESERRSRILDSGTLERVLVFKKRLPMMHRDGWAGPRASSAMAFAWFIWDRAHRGPATLHRI